MEKKKDISINQDSICGSQVSKLPILQEVEPFVS